MSDQDAAVAAIDQVYAEARNDLDRLIGYSRPAVAKYGTEEAAVALTSGLLAQPSWDRMLLASVLGVALVRLAGRGEPNSE